MGLSCGASLVKYGIFIFNLLIAVGGIALIVAGAIPLFKLGEIESVFPEHNPAVVPITIIVLGSIVFIISFFGCCGAIRENGCMISTYAFFLLCIVVLQVVIAVFAFMYTSDLARISREGFERLFTHASADPPSNEARLAIDGIQTGLRCCGTTGPGSWNSSIPDSCCEQTPQQQCNLNNSFSDGCAVTIYDFVNGSGLLIAWIAVCFAAIQLVGVIFACCLANSIRNAQRRQYT